MKDDELLHKWVNGQLSPEEQKNFAQRPEYASLQALERGMDRLSAPRLKEEKVLAAVLATPKTQSSPRRVRIRRLLPYAAAAAVLLVMGFFFLRSPSSTVYTTGWTEQLAQELPDGSTVRLNADSKLTFTERQWPESRSLDLQGEAFFKVKPGSTFTVVTPNGEVRVTGTSFNVVSRAGMLEVSCYSGSVVVEILTRQLRYELNAGEGTRFTSGNDPQQWSLDQNAAQAPWLTGITRLRAVPLAYAVSELQRQFGLTFKTNNVDLAKIVTVNFQHQEIGRALLTVFGPLNIRYERKENQEVHLFQE